MSRRRSDRNTGFPPTREIRRSGARRARQTPVPGIGLIVHVRRARVASSAPQRLDDAGGLSSSRAPRRPVESEPGRSHEASPRDYLHCVCLRLPAIGCLRDRGISPRGPRSAGRSRRLALPADVLFAQRICRYHPEEITRTSTIAIKLIAATRSALWGEKRVPRHPSANRLDRLSAREGA